MNYFVEVSCTELNCSHTITANGIDIYFNTSYDVEVTAVNTCGEKSSPENVTVRIDDNGKFSNNNNVVTVYRASLDISFPVPVICLLRFLMLITLLQSWLL